MTTESNQPRILVAGLGNLLMRDDGVGVHAVRELAGDATLGATVMDVGTAVWHMTDLMQESDRVLAIDAMRAGGAPGSIYLVDAGDVEAHAGPASVHSLGLPEMMRWLPPGTGPEDVVVLGIEPEQVDYGMELSPAVKAALPLAIDEVRRIVARWRKEGEE